VPHLHTLRIPLTKCDEAAAIAALLSHPSLTHLEVSIDNDPATNSSAYGSDIAVQEAGQPSTGLVPFCPACSSCRCWLTLAACMYLGLCDLCNPAPGCPVARAVQLNSMDDCDSAPHEPSLYPTSGKLCRLELHNLCFGALASLPGFALDALSLPDSSEACDSNRLLLSLTPEALVPGFNSPNLHEHVS
jgi:hypothetical protein